MNVTFNPNISYKRNTINRNQRPNNAQYMTFGNWDMGVKTVEDFFKKSPDIETFLTCLKEHTQENEKLIADIRKKAAENEDWDITSIIDWKWYKRQPFKG